MTFLTQRYFEDDLQDLRARVLEQAKQLRLLWTKLGNKLLDRWPKLKTEQRESLVLDVDSNMPYQRRPELDLPDDLASFYGQPGDQYADYIDRVFHLPWITVQDLSHGHNLLLLLQSRATNAPGHFALYDLMQAGIPVFGHNVDPLDPLLDQAMMFSHVDNQLYGQLQPKNHFQLMQAQFPPDVGYALLRIHRSLYATLTGIASEILKGADLAERALGFRKDANLLGLATKIERLGMPEAPFCGPTEVDFSVLDTTISDKRRDTLTHMMQLRESLPYLTSCTQDWIDHIDGYISFGVWAALRSHRFESSFRAPPLQR